jgi:hypothetical protein
VTAWLPGGRQGRRSLIRLTKARQVSGVKVSAGPVGSLESRTATTPGRLSATSTQLPPLPLLRRVVPAQDGLPGQASRQVAFDVAAQEEAGLPQHGPGVRLGLEQSGQHQGFERAQRHRSPLDLLPRTEPDGLATS